MKILSVVGARPQFIKASVMSRFFLNNPQFGIHEVLLHTGQHFNQNMSEIFFAELRIPTPTYNLGVNNVSHGKMTAKIMEGVEEVLVKEKPEYVMVYGDTNSTLAGALAAKKMFVKVIHVEAGLRSYNMKMPEEINRILTDRISDILCCPTVISVENLKREGFENFNCTVKHTGDVMVDALRYAESSIDQNTSFFKDRGLPENKYAICTLHRQENVDDPVRLSSIASALEELSLSIPIIVPLHPRTQQKIRFNSDNIITIDPLGYLDSLRLLKHCEILLTDSGGMQKEAYLFKKYCITMRDETEWTELVESKCNVLVGADKEKIISTYKLLSEKLWTAPQNLYGEEEAAKKICAAILSHQ
jgi:UDP-GlcNAc3NAcA epimerase